MSAPFQACPPPARLFQAEESLGYRVLIPFIVLFMAESIKSVVHAAVRIHGGISVFIIKSIRAGIVWTPARIYSEATFNRY